MLTSKLFSFLYNDQRLQEFNAHLVKAKKQVDITQLELEIETKLDKRVQLKSVSLAGDVDFLDLRNMIITNSVESQLLRSRLSHLRIEVYKHLKRLEEYSENVRKYLFIEHKLQLEQLGMKTQADKNYIIETCFFDCNTFITELKVLQESLVFFIEDLDKNLWTLKNLVDVLELAFRGRNVV